uniref:Uncharacterized protein n=1 Tax=Chrysemys picta bellii TaxID=8478 RepID=A0A8C3I5N3_CHRPI
IRYGAWYLDPKTWRKQRVNEPLEDPKAAADAIQNLRKRFSEKVLHLWNLGGDILILVQGCRTYLEKLQVKMERRLQNRDGPSPISVNKNPSYHLHK